MSEDKNDISNSLEDAKREPKDESPDRGFIATSDEGETIKLGEKPELTKNIKS